MGESSKFACMFIFMDFQNTLLINVPSLFGYKPRLLLIFVIILCGLQSRVVYVFYLT